MQLPSDVEAATKRLGSSELKRIPLVERVVSALPFSWQTVTSLRATHPSLRLACENQPSWQEALFTHTPSSLGASGEPKQSPVVVSPCGNKVLIAPVSDIRQRRGIADKPSLKCRVPGISACGVHLDHEEVGSILKDSETPAEPFPHPMVDPHAATQVHEGFGVPLEIMRPLFVFKFSSDGPRRSHNLKNPKEQHGVGVACQQARGRPLTLEGLERLVQTSGSTENGTRASSTTLPKLGRIAKEISLQVTGCLLTPLGVLNLAKKLHTMRFVDQETGLEEGPSPVALTLSAIMGSTSVVGLAKYPDLPITTLTLSSLTFDNTAAVRGLGRLKHLKQLLVDNCDFVPDPEPPFELGLMLQGSPSIEDIALSRVHGVDLTGVEKLSTLESLWFDAVRMTTWPRDESGKEFVPTCALQVLSYSQCGRLDPHLRMENSVASNIVEVNVSHTDCRTIERLAWCPSLETVVAAGCYDLARIVDSAFPLPEERGAVIPAFPSLRFLNLSGSGLRDQMQYRAIASLGELLTLNVSLCPDVEHITELRHSRSIRFLHAQECRLAVDAVAAIVEMPALERFFAAHCVVGDAHLRAIQPRAAASEEQDDNKDESRPLSVFHLSFNAKVVDCTALLQFPKLQKIKLNGTGVADLRWIREGSFPLLQELHLDKCNIPEEELASLAFLPSLEVLSFVGGPSSTVKTTTPLGACKSLVKLSLRGHVQLHSATGLDNLAKLKFVDLSNTNLQDGLESVAACPALEHLVAHGVPKTVELCETVAQGPVQKSLQVLSVRAGGHPAAPHLPSLTLSTFSGMYELLALEVTGHDIVKENCVALPPKLAVLDVGTLGDGEATAAFLRSLPETKGALRVLKVSPAPPSVSVAPFYLKHIVSGR